MVGASGLLALLTGVAFAMLLWAIIDLNEAVDERRYTRTALVEAGIVENLIVDLETGQRGFLITRQENFLKPWEDARTAFPGQAREFARFSLSPEERVLAQQIIQGESPSSGTIRFRWSTRHGGTTPTRGAWRRTKRGCDASTR
ncbi:CHASE3 domain-containing protein [Streptosporangium lutulentum]